MMRWMCALLLAGCVPFAVPPATASVGAVHTSTMQAPIGVHADVGLSPVQVMTGQQHRWWDATLSGSFEHVDRNRDAWGAALAAGPVLHPWGIEPTDTVSLRVLPQLVARWTTTGYALDARVEVERSDFADRMYTSKDAACYARGEVAI